MCRWGCETTDTTYMCKWCGTRFCKSCKRGEFGTGYMQDSNWCFQCNQKKCQGKRVEYVPAVNCAEGKSAKGSGRKMAKGTKTPNRGADKAGKKKKSKKK